MEHQGQSHIFGSGAAGKGTRVSVAIDPCKTSGVALVIYEGMTIFWKDSKAFLRPLRDSNIRLSYADYAELH